MFYYVITNLNRLPTVVVIYIPGTKQTIELGIIFKLLEKGDERTLRAHTTIHLYTQPQYADALGVHNSKSSLLLHIYIYTGCTQTALMSHVLSHSISNWPRYDPRLQSVML